MFSTRMGLSKFWCMYFTYKDWNNCMTASCRIENPRTWNRCLRYVWDLFFPWFLAKSQMCICTEVKKIFKKGVPVKKVYWILFRSSLRRRLFKINYQNWKRFTKNKYFLCSWKSSMVNKNAKKPRYGRQKTFLLSYSEEYPFP